MKHEGGSRIPPAKDAVRGGVRPSQVRGGCPSEGTRWCLVCEWWCARPQPHGFPRLSATPSLTGRPGHTREAWSLPAAAAGFNQDGEARNWLALHNEASPLPRPQSHMPSLPRLRGPAQGCGNVTFEGAATNGQRETTPKTEIFATTLTRRQQH